MARALNVETTTVPGGAVIKIVGVINENFRADMFASVVQDSVVIDLDGADLITSIGVREWIHGLERMPASQIAFINCRPAIVLQFNMVHGFAGPGQIVSLYLPYACTDCDEEIEILVDLRKEYEVVTAGPKDSIDCPHCGGRAQFDELGLLGYVQSQPRPIVTDTIDKLIDGDLDALRVRSFKIQKEIADGITAMWLSGPIRHDLSLKRATMGLDGTVVVIFDDVREIDPRGIVRLEPLLFNEDAAVHLARAPIALLEALDPALASRLHRRVLSVSLTLDCKGCGKHDALLTRLPDAGRDAIECPRCGRETFFSSKGRRSDLARFIELEPPKSIVEYLASRKNGPITERAPSTGRRTESEIIGRYQIIRRIGIGGMAEIFLASQIGPQGFERKVVIKKILPKLAQDPEFIRMFLQEARMAARISHPNVVQVFELGQNGDEYFIAMEYVKGWSLNAILRAIASRQERFPIDLACRLIADVCAGLHAAHTCAGDGSGVVHRDMSPHNILISEQGSVKLVDFGISKADDAESQTKTGAIKGKVAYLAPEQIDREHGEIDRRTDVLGTGLVLFEVLSGISANKRDTEYTTLMASLECAIPDVRKYRDDVPTSVAAIVRRATHKTKSDRYPSAREFQLALEEAIGAMGRSVSSAHLAHWLEAAALDAVRDGRLGAAGLSQTSLDQSDHDTILV